ncbi:uncharacterized protein PAC_05365 [Phialocephala subalpina]|uniref:Zn(2)-C6 fungal-type domain-containing protein n=1 Tax=Phialocephala subalpina TaxID=576137 RepID=A0A1L7WRU8_9HELO|nr:uncharacterized protein PAC_05365 [Phialocephala subalpina]
MDPTQTARAPKASQACMLCKARKRRCDGGTPKCANCIARGVECNYAAVRKTRGPGKKKILTENLEERLNTTQHLSPVTWLPNNDDTSPDTRDDTIVSTTASTEKLIDPRLLDGFIANQPNALQSTTSMDSSQTQVSVRNHLPIFPDFLLPGKFDEHLKTFKTIIAEVKPARNFTPFMPQHISRRLIENSFAEVMAEHRLLDQTNFVMLLDAQYAASSLDPADDSARWALVNAIIALAVRFKTASGSEKALFDIPHGFFQNVTRVVPELILQEPSLLVIQALLAMAMFARCIADVQAFIMLATNASRQLELLGRFSMDRVIDMREIEQYEQVYKAANMFDKTIAGILSTGAALPEG